MNSWWQGGGGAGADTELLGTGQGRAQVLLVQRDAETGLKVVGQTSSRGALGLGLSLVRRIARAHGGDATIENRPNHLGALATIFLPREGDLPGTSGADESARI